MGTRSGGVQNGPGMDRQNRSRQPQHGLLGARHHQVGRPLSALLLGVIVRENDLGHRARHESHADPNDPAYLWTDEGFVVRTQDGGNHNAIDPAIFHDNDGSLWMTYGSYWTGIKLIQLDPHTGKRKAPDSPLHSLAFNESIEASYLCRH